MGDDHAALLAAKGENTVLFLYTDNQGKQLQVVAIRKIETQLDGKRIPYERIDGLDPNNKDLRKAMWTISGKPPGTYPIVFIGSKFIADGESFQELLDSGEFETAFANVPRSE